MIGLDPTVMVATLGCFIGVNRFGFAITDRLDPFRIDTELVDNVLLDSFGTSLGELLIISVFPHVIGVAFNSDCSVGIVLQELAYRIYVRHKTQV